MHKLLRNLVWVLAAILVLAVGLFTYLCNADLSIYQEHVESYVSRRIGHTLEIGGRFELHFGSTTTVVAEKVALSNEDWTGDAELISAGNLTLSFDTWSLMSSPLIIEELSAKDISAYAMRDEGGKLNWAAQLPKRSDPDRQASDLDRIVFRNVNIQDIEFTYTDPARPRPVHTSIDRLTVSPDVNDILDLDIAGTVNDLPLWADGKLGPWHNFIDGRDIIANLDVSLGELRLAVDGSIADLVKLHGVEFNSVLAGPDIAGVLERLVLPPFASGAFELVASIQQFETGHQLRVDGNLGEIEVFLSGSMDNLLSPNQVAHDFRIAGPDAQYVAELFGIGNVSASPFQISGDYSRSDRMLTFHDAVLSVGDNSILFSGDVDLSNRVPDWDLQVSASGPDFSTLGPFINVSGLPRESFSIAGHVAIDEAKWLTEGVDIVVGANRLTINGQLVPGGSGKSQIDIQATGPDISFFQDFTAVEGIPPGPYDISATIRPDPLGIQIDDGLGVFGDNRLGFDGVIALRHGLDGTALHVVARGPEVRNIVLLAAVPDHPGGPFEVEGRVEFHRDAIQLDDVRGTVGELRGTASGSVLVAGMDRGDFDLEVSASGPDVILLGDKASLQRFAGEPFSLAGNIRHQGSTVSTTGLEASLGSLNAQLQGHLVGEQRLLAMTIGASADDSEVLRKFAELRYLPDGPVAVDGTVEISATDVSFTNAALSIGDYKLSADGSLNLTALSNDSDLKFSVLGPDLSEAGRVFGRENLPQQAFSVSGQFNGTPGGFAVRDFLAKVGGDDLLGEMSVDLQDKPKISGSLVAARLDISGRVQPPNPDPQLEEEVGSDNTVDLFFSDEPLDTSWLQRADFDVDLEVDDFIGDYLRLKNLNVSVNVLDGALSIEPIQARDELGSFGGRLYLTPQDGIYFMEASLQIDGMRVGRRASQEQDRSTLPPMNGRLELSGTGDSLHSIMAASNGNLSLRQGAGRVKEVVGIALFQDVLLQVLRTLNPERHKRGYQLLECGIYDISFEDGRATIEDFVIQTDMMTTVAKGTVDLRNERLDIAFRAKPREGLGLTLGTVANRVLELRGTIESPQITVDVVKTAAITGVAVATGGLSLVARGLWDRLSAEASICDESK